MKYRQYKFTIKTLAETCGVSESTIRNDIASGKCPASIGRNGILRDGCLLGVAKYIITAYLKN